MAKPPMIVRATTALSRMVYGSTAPVVADPAPVRLASPASDNATPATGMASRAYDGGFYIDAAWLSALALNPDSILQREGARDLRLFDALLDDPVAFTAFQQRQLALVSRPWVVEPGNPDDPMSVQAADDLRADLNALGWDRVCRLMSYGMWYGYAVAEAIWELRTTDGRTRLHLDDIVVPDRKWFAFTNAGELRQRTPGTVDGEVLPDNKFWSYRTGGSHDFALYGAGLAHWCYWPIWFKRNVLQFWALFLEKFGQPTVVGYFPSGATQEDIDELLAALTAIGKDSAVALPAPPSAPVGGGAAPDLKPGLMEAQRSGSGADSYRQLMQAMNDELRGVILSQPSTSDSRAAGMNSNTTDVHKDVRDEVIKADSDVMHESFNSTFPVWLTRWNYGPGVAPPTVYRNLDDAEDLTAVAERDTQLDGLGWRRTDDSFRETYGDGYERKPEPVQPPPIPGRMPGVPGAPPAADDKLAAFAVGETMPLYVSRPLLNAAELIAWAHRQGFKVTEAAAELHVTVLYSRTPVDPFAMPEDWWSDRDGELIVKAGGARAVEQLGPQGAIVLRFVSRELQRRNEDMIDSGASSDWPTYTPHVTITYDGQGVDLATVEPFDGELRFGPEKFERLELDPLASADLPAFSAAQLDAVDRLTDALVLESDPLIAAMGEALRDRIASFEASGTPITEAGLRLAMLQAFERFPLEQLGRIMAMPFVAERAGAAAGVADQIEP